MVATSKGKAIEADREGSPRGWVGVALLPQKKTFALALTFISVGDIMARSSSYY